jgi:hypothetical protein
VHRQSLSTLEEILERVPLEAEPLREVLDRLVAAGRVSRVESGATTRYGADSCIIPLGQSAGWEASVFDHYQAMVTAVCAKIREGKTRADAEDTVGGSTYGFTVWEGHPDYDEVLGLLGRIRRELAVVRTRVRSYNERHAPPEDAAVGVITYVGQNVIRDERPESEES